MKDAWMTYACPFRDCEWTYEHPRLMSADDLQRFEDATYAHVISAHCVHYP